MSDYRRTTRDCTLDQLRPELAEAVRAYAQRQQWDNFEADVLACCETTAERISTNRLDAWLNGSAAAITYLALIATPQRLIWAYSTGSANAPAPPRPSTRTCASKSSGPNTRRTSPWMCMRTWTARARKRAGDSCWTPVPPPRNSAKPSCAPPITSIRPKWKSRAASGSGDSAHKTCQVSHSLAELHRRRVAHLTGLSHPIGITFE